MKTKKRGIIEQFEMYKKYIKGKQNPYEQKNMNPFLKEFYGPESVGWPTIKKYAKMGAATQKIIDEVKPEGHREWLLEGILQVKYHPDDMGLYDIVLAAIEQASLPDLVEEFSRVASSYGELEKKAVNQ
ncbi:MAG: hypothetical protein V1645_01930 [archaeon]